MSVALHLPDDPGESQRWLDDLLRRNDELRQQAETAQRQAETAQQQADDARRRIDELERVLAETATDYHQLQQRHAELAETLALLRRYVFGPRRERLTDDPGQGHLFDLLDSAGELEAAASPEPETADPGEPPKPGRPKRRTSLDHLRHHRIEHDIPEADKICSGCGGGKHRIGEDLSRELEFTPAKLEVHVHVLPKYACPRCRDGVASPPVPPKPVPGGIAGPGLIASVLVSKFADHLPLYRLEDILTRHGVFLSRSTLCDWVRNAADLLGPLADLQKTRVLESSVLWTNSTSFMPQSEPWLMRHRNLGYEHPPTPPH
jgi:transposase